MFFLYVFGSVVTAMCEDGSDLCRLPLKVTIGTRRAFDQNFWHIPEKLLQSFLAKECLMFNRRLTSLKLTIL